MRSSTPPALAPAGSRRRRLWELDGHAHCPVIGVCMPIAALRRLVDKVLGGQAVADDYELHCGVVADCRLRTPMAEALQRELDRRYAMPLRQAAKAKTTDALKAWWREALSGGNVAGAFWSVISHPRCDAVLENAVLGEIHMLQHQLGMAQRVDLTRFEALIDENAVLARELAAAQQRSTRQQQEQARRIEQQQAEIVRLRGELMGRDTLLAQTREQLQALEEATPQLKTRFELMRENQRQVERIHELQRAALLLQQEAERQRHRADQAQALLRDAAAAPAGADEQRDAPAAPPERMLRDCAVLCVGGRPASVPVYRQVIERTGGRFLHHDGGEEDNPAKLDATLAAADLVICQTGCISHDAYWRVKDHCKRTGKRCVFVETPSRAGLERALGELGELRREAGDTPLSSTT